MKELVFVGHSYRSSGLIRGKQVSERMPGSRFVEATDMNAIGRVRDQVCLIVRQPEPEVARVLKRNGCKVGYDLLDRPVSDYHDKFARGKSDGDFDWACYANLNIDFYVVNNTAAKTRLSEALTRAGVPKPVHVIPHHTVNLGSDRNVVGDNVKRVGYVGFSNQFSAQDEIKDFCARQGVELVSVNPATREECVAVMRSLDVGVVFVDQTEKVPYTLTYKPNTKLSNFQSFGVPTIAVPYESFNEFGGDAWVKVGSFDEFKTALQKLIDDKNAREALNAAGWEHAKNFHVDNVVRERYEALLED